MLEAIRNSSKGPIAKFIMGLIIIPFAFAGVYSYFNFNNSNAVATVNDSDITLAEFEQAYRQQQQNWGENFDRFFSTDERIQQFRMNVLQQLINQRLSSQAIVDMGLRGSDNVLREQIKNTADFQDENGNFNIDRYKLLVQSAGLTVNRYQQSLKNDLATEQFFSGLETSNFSLDHELVQHQILEGQTRDIDYITLQKQAFSNNIDFSTEEGIAEINSYYEINKDQFRIPEKVSIDYIVLSKSDFLNVEISEQQVSEYYLDNKSNYEGTERRRVAHILVNVPVDADQAGIDSARAKIDAAKGKLDAGESFESVVTEYSDDTVSADMGGDLDWIEEGMMDEAFEAEALSMSEIGSISSVVRSTFGFHIIKLLDLESGAAKPLDEIKDEIIAQLKDKVAEDNYLDAKDILAEKAFEYSDSLADAAEALGTEVKSTQLFDRQFGIGLPPELQTNPVVIQNAFSDETLIDQVNSEVIDLTDDSALVIRKKDYQEAGVRSIEEVSSQIETMIIATKASEQTDLTAQQITDGLKLGSSLDALAMSLPEALKTITWSTQKSLSRVGTEVDAQIRTQAFNMDLTSEAVSKVQLANGDYAVIRLTAVNRPEANLLTVATEAQKFTEFYKQSELSGYIKYLDSKANVIRMLSNAEIVQ